MYQRKYYRRRGWYRRSYGYRSYRRKSPGGRHRVRNPFITAAFFLALVFAEVTASGKVNPRQESFIIGGVAAFSIIATSITAWRWLKRKQAYRAIEFEHIDSMPGRTFEEYMARVFRNLSFGVKHVGKTGDQGCDLLLVRHGRRIACQLKRYSGSVGNDAVQQAVAAVRFYNCDSSMVVTNRHFTRSAKELAKRNNCELVERERLGIMVASLRKGRRP